jgi:hypothetical protein
MHDDLYRTALDSKTIDDEKKYRHILYKAHDEERCTQDHTDVKPWPEGCLLDPHRLPWKMLETVRRNNARTFQVQYQQEDGDTVGGLVEDAWIKGGVDSMGYPAPGCLDRERSIGQVPEHLTQGRAWSFVTVDPSPTEYWSVQWWLYEPATNRRYLIELVNKRMNPEDFLMQDIDDQKFSGVLETLRRAALLTGAPIRDVIFEINAAQRWFLSQPQVQRWIDVTGIQIIPHTTSANKADPKFGVESLSVLFRDGAIRLPWSGPSTQMKVKPFIDEHLRYPESDTDDNVMADWFHHLGVVHHYVPAGAGFYRREVPGYVSRGRSGSPVQRGLSYAR